MKKNNSSLTYKIPFVFAFFISLIIGLWSFNNKALYHTCLAVRFSSSNIPIVDVVIEGKKYPLKVDLGSSMQMDIYEDEMSNLTKKKCGTHKWINLLGGRFEHNKYTIPEIQLGTLSFKEVEALETSPESSCVFWENSSQEVRNLDESVGVIGRGILKKTNLLLDLKNSKIIASNNIKKLRENGYLLKSFHRFPFELSEKGIIIQVDTDLGNMNFCLDTGATCTVISNAFSAKTHLDHTQTKYGLPVFCSSKFIINGQDLGKVDLHLIKFGTDAKKAFDNIQGFIGMDLLKKHIVYIDFANRSVYIKSHDQ